MIKVVQYVVKENVHWKSKSARKQKKKDNSSKDQKESQDQSDSMDVGSRTKHREEYQRKSSIIKIITSLGKNWKLPTAN